MANYLAIGLDTFLRFLKSPLLISLSIMRRQLRFESMDSLHRPLQLVVHIQIAGIEHVGPFLLIPHFVMKARNLLTIHPARRNVESEKSFLFHSYEMLSVRIM